MHTDYNFVFLFWNWTEDNFAPKQIITYGHSDKDNQKVQFVSFSGEQYNGYIKALLG